MAKDLCLFLGDEPRIPGHRASTASHRHPAPAPRTGIPRRSVGSERGDANGMRTEHGTRTLMPTRTRRMGRARFHPMPLAPSLRTGNSRGACCSYSNVLPSYSSFPTGHPHPHPHPHPRTIFWSAPPPPSPDNPSRRPRARRTNLSMERDVHECAGEGERRDATARIRLEGKGTSGGTAPGMDSPAGRMRGGDDALDGRPRGPLFDDWCAEQNTSALKHRGQPMRKYWCGRHTHMSPMRVLARTVLTIAPLPSAQFQFKTLRVQGWSRGTDILRPAYAGAEYKARAAGRKMRRVTGDDLLMLLLPLLRSTPAPRRRRLKMRCAGVRIPTSGMPWIGRSTGQMKMRSHSRREEKYVDRKGMAYLQAVICGGIAPEGGSVPDGRRRHPFHVGLPLQNEICDARTGWCWVGGGIEMGIEQGLLLMSLRKSQLSTNWWMTSPAREDRRQGSTPSDWRTDPREDGAWGYCPAQLTFIDILPVQKRILRIWWLEWKGGGRLDDPESPHPLSQLDVPIDTAEWRELNSVEFPLRSLSHASRAWVPHALTVLLRVLVASQHYPRIFAPAAPARAAGQLALAVRYAVPRALTLPRLALSHRFCFPRAPTPLHAYALNPPRGGHTNDTITSVFGAVFSAPEALILFEGFIVEAYPFDIICTSASLPNRTLAAGAPATPSTFHLGVARYPYTSNATAAVSRCRCRFKTGVTGAIGIDPPNVRPRPCHHRATPAFRARMLVDNCQWIGAGRQWASTTMCRITPEATG
ncbi:hypothetical protein DFH07DRAFT_1058433 [Mycena maculata]|uniref:Uncharacterized protein n=1 Tax=Mycena maculata TaxID=230809 RepID=A0AAD7JQC0_9AGAR|nr:hypothetical protein DFH07DRAFT_1058433 [Mycena maculata]